MSPGWQRIEVVGPPGTVVGIAVDTENVLRLTVRTKDGEFEQQPLPETTHVLTKQANTYLAQRAQQPEGKTCERQ